MNSALEVIRAEHQALAAMLRSMLMLVAQHRRQQTLPEFDVLRAMLFYVDEFPERLHHTKESEHLFPRILVRCPELAGVIAQLEIDHRDGERAIRELEHALLAFEVMGEPRREAFEQQLQHYVSFYLAHMAIEEEQVLPAALRVLSAEEWAELDAVFTANRDPLTGHQVDDIYHPLFTKIVMSVPAPSGLRPH